MPRTLFNVIDKEGFAEMNKSCPPFSRYTWLPQVQKLRIGDSYILINPENGGWTVLNKDEYFSVKTNSGPPRGLQGEFLYKVGLCASDGRTKNFVKQSEYTEQLYFFEFAVTTGCNLACKYCFAKSHPLLSREKATTELAELFIDRIAEYRVTARTLVPFIIEFTGGEPLMNFNTIRHTVEYAKREYGDLLNAEFVIQSNLTLLNDDILRFARDHRIGIGVSCDGFKEVNDKQRPFANGRGSHSILDANMIKLRKMHPENSGSIITVVTQENVDKMAEIVLYLYLCGYREINLRPMAELGRGATSYKKKPFSKSYVEGLFKVLSSVITPIYHKTGELIQEQFISRTFQHLFHPYRAFMCERSPCGAARNICIVMPNGDAYPCNQSTDDKQLLLGNIKTSTFSELLETSPAKMLSHRTLDMIEECQVCTFRSWCGSPCPNEAFVKYGSFMAMSPGCDIFRLRYETALTGLIKDEFDLSVVGRLAGFDGEINWIEINEMKGGDFYGRKNIH